MKKRQDQFLQVLRWGLVVFFLGMVILGFYWNYQKMKRVRQGPQIEITVPDPGKAPPFKTSENEK